jgi:hypothetical protein
MQNSTVQAKILIPWHDIISEQVHHLEKQQKVLENKVTEMIENNQRTIMAFEESKKKNTKGWLW